MNISENHSTHNQYDKSISVLLAIYCILLPFEEAFASSFGSILKLIGIFVMIRAVMLFPNQSFKIQRVFLPLFIWIIYSGVSYIWSEDVSWWSYFYKIYLFQFIFLVVVCNAAAKIDFEYMKKGLIAGALISSCLLIFFPSASAYTSEGRRTIILLDKAFDPNIVASIIMIGLFCCISYFFAEGILRKTKKDKAFLIIITMILFAGMLFTGSRGALISSVAVIVIELFLEFKESGQRKTVLAVIILAGLAACVLINNLPSSLMESRFSSNTLFGQNEYSSDSHNRYKIWQYAVGLFPESPVFGYGCGNFFSAIATVYKQCASHNVYMLVLIEGGLVGAFFFLSGLLLFLKRLLVKKQYSIFSLLLSVCVMATTLDTITYKYFWVSIIASYLALYQCDRVCQQAGREATKQISKAAESGCKYS